MKIARRSNYLFKGRSQPSRALDGAVPLFEFFPPLRFLHNGQIRSFGAPKRADLLQVLPHPYRQSRQRRGAQGRRFVYGGAEHLFAENTA